jgi:hypothetical protein
MVKAPRRNESINGLAVVSVPNPNQVDGALPVLKRWLGCNIPRTAPTITNNKVSPTIPIISVPTAALLIRVDQKVEKTMSTICTTITIVVASHAF